jgi:type I pantothenate kinase
MSNKPVSEDGFSPYRTFNRNDWAKLRDVTPLPLTEEELISLKGLNEKLSMEEVLEIYLPLSRLLNLYVGATQELHNATDTFLGRNTDKVPYMIGIAGSVAVGKSTTARILQALLARWPNHPKVDLVTTDGFLYPNRILEERGLMKRKGFPESYDIRRLIQFMAEVKSGQLNVKAPVYSHLYYDIIPNEEQIIQRPDIVIVEGINVLQITRHKDKNSPSVFVSDFFDFSIYVDAKEVDIYQWYVERFQLLRGTAFKNPHSYFHQFASLTDQEAEETAKNIWKEINAVNLLQNILPTRSRAHLILEKGVNHLIQQVKLRKL